MTEIVLVDDNQKKWTAEDIRRVLDKANAEVRAKHGGKYRVVFSWSNYWRRGMFFCQERVWWFFWKYIRREDHMRVFRWAHNERTTAFNPDYFLEYVFDKMEQQRRGRLVTIVPKEA